MEPARERVLVLSQASGCSSNTEWWLVGRGWRDPVMRLVESDPALASRITVVTDPEDPDLGHGSRLGVRVQVRADIVNRVAQGLRGVRRAGDAGPHKNDLPETPAVVEPPLSARSTAIDATRRLLLARGLSRREAEVAALAAEGDDNAQIAAVLFLSPITVKRHLTHAYRKLGVRQRAGLLALVHGAGPRANP